MGNKGRWVEPSDRTARDEYRSLRRELKLVRTSKTRRTEIENRLDEISSTGGTKEPSLGIREPTSVNDGSKKPTREDIDAWGKRIEDRRDGIPRPAVAPFFDSKAWLARMAVEDRAKAIRRAENATPQEKAEVILADLPEHPLRKLAAELALSIWLDDRSNPKPSPDLEAVRWVKHWLSDSPHNRHGLSGSRAMVDAAVANALKLVAEKDVADPDWFVRRAEKLFDAPPTLTKPTATSESIQTGEPLEQTDGEIKKIATRKSPASPAPVSSEPVPMLDPIVRAGADLAARAELVLKTDGWLLRLAQHSPDLHTKIVVALKEELYQNGSVGSDFATRLYNNLRPRALSQFPPRQF